MLIRSLAAGALAACVLPWLAGCAVVSVMEDAEHEQRAMAAPSSAMLVPQGGAQCRTPCRIDLGALPEEFDLRIQVEGFGSGRVIIRNRGGAWQADASDLGSIPCLAIDTVRGEVYRIAFEDIRRRPIDAALLGGGETGQLYAVAVTDVEPSWASVLHLFPE